jgi:hypothetical protein
MKDYLRAVVPEYREARASGAAALERFKAGLFAAWFVKWPPPDRMPGDDKPDPDFCQWFMEKRKIVCIS